MVVCTVTPAASVHKLAISAAKSVAGIKRRSGAMAASAPCRGASCIASFTKLLKLQRPLCIFAKTHAGAYAAASSRPVRRAGPVSILKSPPSFAEASLNNTPSLALPMPQDLHPNSLSPNAGSKILQPLERSVPLGHSTKLDVLVQNSA